MLNPTSAKVTSPDHNSVYADGQNKISSYHFVATSDNDPSNPDAEQDVDRTALVNTTGDEYTTSAVATLFNSLPTEYSGKLFVRPDGPQGNGEFGTGIAFLRGSLPAATNVIDVF